MIKKWIIAVGVLLASIIVITYLYADNLNLLPKQVGVMIVRDDLDQMPQTLDSADYVIVDSDSADNETVDSADSEMDSIEDLSPSNQVAARSQSDDIQIEAVDAALQEELGMFYFEELTQGIKDRINGKSYGENCKVPYDELRYVKVLYWGFDQEAHVGEMIVNKAIAEDIVAIFEELYEQKYPIEQMVLVDEYDADDNASMTANNSSAFNYRVIDGTERLSIHSYGLAIDINPLYNPYVREMDGKTIITPEEGKEFADRSLDCEYYIKKDDICYKAFTSRGFTWGGDWQKVKDYQHFQKKVD